MPATLEVPAGLARTFTLQARGADGAAFAPGANPSPFDGSETLAGVVWQGEALPALATPAAAWSDAATATFTVTLTAAQTAALGAGLFLARVTVASGGATGELFTGRLRVTDAPGADAAAPAFTRLEHLLEYCPWVEDVQDDRVQFSFLREQRRATTRLIDDLVNGTDVTSMAPTIGQPGFTAMAGGGYLASPPNKWLFDQLVPLAVGSTPPPEYPYRAGTPANLYDGTVSTALLLKDFVREVCAKRALAFVLAAQLGANAEREWWPLARRFRREADGLYRRCRFEVDLSDPQTGYASLTVHGGGGSVR